MCVAGWLCFPYKGTFIVKWQAELEGAICQQQTAGDSGKQAPKYTLHSGGSPGMSPVPSLDQDLKADESIQRSPRQFPL